MAMSYGRVKVDKKMSKIILLPELGRVVLALLTAVAVIDGIGISYHEFRCVDISSIRYLELSIHQAFDISSFRYIELSISRNFRYIQGIRFLETFDTSRAFDISKRSIDTSRAFDISKNSIRYVTCIERGLHSIYLMWPASRCTIYLRMYVCRYIIR